MCWGSITHDRQARLQDNSMWPTMGIHAAAAPNTACLMLQLTAYLLDKLHLPGKFSNLPFSHAGETAAAGLCCCLQGCMLAGIGQQGQRACSSGMHQQQASVLSH
jgi:hypothetical protein